MKTTSVTLYALQYDIKGKNVIFDTLTFASFLSNAVRTKTISNNQYQKVSRYMSIDVKLSSQIPEVWDDTPANTQRFNYLSMTFVTGADSQTYYFFITKETWLSNGGSVRYELEMDVLNTYKMDETGSLGYSCTNRTRITRCHQDRVEVDYIQSDSKTRVIRNPSGYSRFLTFVGAGSAPTGNKHERYAMTGVEAWKKTPDNTGFYVICYAEDGDGNALHPITFHLQNASTGASIDENYGQALAVFTYQGHITIQLLSYDSGAYDDIASYTQEEEYTFGGQDPSVNDLGQVLVVDFEYLDTDVYDPSGNKAFVTHLDDNSPFDFDTFIRYIYLTNNTRILTRKIDRHPEGVNPILFKQSEETLYDVDEGRLWYLVFANANPPASGSDTEPHYINPVKISLIPSDPLESNSVALTNTIIYPSALTFPGKLTFLIFSALYLSGTTLTFDDEGGVSHTLEVSALGTAGKPSSVVLHRYYAENHFYIRSYEYTSDGEISNVTEYDNVASVTITSCGSCKRITNTTSDDFNILRNPYTAFATTLKTYDYYIGAGSSSIDDTSVTIDTLDLTDEKLIKVIEYPYAPASWLVGISDMGVIPENFAYNASTHMLQVSTSNIPEFISDKVLPNVDSPFKDMIVEAPATCTKNDGRSDKYESKLYNSEFRMTKFVYDSFAFPFRLENVSIDLLPNDYQVFRFTYLVSRNITSKFAVSFPQYKEGLIEGIEDYDAVLVVSRNNEKALFSNAYLTYLRQGLNYDRKSQESNNLARGISIGLTALGAIASFASTPASGPMGIAGGIGLLTSLGGQVAGAIHSANQTDRALQQKQAELQRQSESVSTAEDLDILHFYSQGKPKLVTYRVSDYMRNAVSNLFYWYGYSCDFCDSPNVARDTRIGFNFVQCELDLKTFYGGEEEREALLEAYKAGVFFVHDTNIFFNARENWEKLVYEDYNS